MDIKQATALAQADDPYIKEVYTAISKTGNVHNIAGDSVTPVIEFSANAVDEIQAITYQHVQARHLERGLSFESPTEALHNMEVKMAGDALFNPKNRVGTLIDPSVYTHSNIPIMTGPGEATALYASGGLPTEIIEKKTRALVSHGATFKGFDDKFWDNDKIDQLEETADTTGFNDVAADAISDAFIYGGSVLYPELEGESPTSLLRPIDRLNLEKGCISRWIETDRWNTVIVPSFLVTAKDYINPSTLLIPQTATEISTTRAALIRPKEMPYWATLYNLGWSPSDFNGWIRAYYGYQITMQSIPVMAQQMSLLLYKMPLDGLNATIGPDNVSKLMGINEQKMSEWSALSPKAVNMVGEVEVVDRSYAGFEQFVGAIKSDLAAQCGISEPSLWHTPNKGFSDNTQESMLKNSESMQIIQHYIERSMDNCKDLLIAHTFGRDSEEYKRRHRLKLTFNKPIISTEKDLAEVGARFAASVSSFVQSGVSPDVAIKLSIPFFPSVRVTEDMINAAKTSYEEAQENKADLGRGMGSSVANKAATGHFTK